MAKDLTDAWAALSEEAAGSTTRKDSALPAPKSKSAIPERSGSAKPASGSGSGSLAGPLTETAYSDRTRWANRTLTSTDGIFTWVYAPIKSAKFLDGNSSLLPINFAEPT